MANLITTIYRQQNIPRILDVTDGQHTIGRISDVIVTRKDIIVINSTHNKVLIFDLKNKDRKRTLEVPGAETASCSLSGDEVAIVQPTKYTLTYILVDDDHYRMDHVKTGKKYSSVCYIDELHLAAVCKDEEGFISILERDSANFIKKIQYQVPSLFLEEVPSRIWFCTEADNYVLSFGTQTLFCVSKKGDAEWSVSGIENVKNVWFDGTSACVIWRDKTISKYTIQNTSATLLHFNSSFEDEPWTGFIGHDHLIIACDGKIEVQSLKNIGRMKLSFTGTSGERNICVKEYSNEDRLEMRKAGKGEREEHSHERQDSVVSLPEISSSPAQPRPRLQRPQSVPEMSTTTHKDCYGWTPLHLAIFKQDISTAKKLIESGADLNVKTKSRLHAEQMRKPDISMASTLFIKGNCCKEFHSQELRPLDVAIVYRKVESLSFLLQQQTLAESQIRGLVKTCLNDKCVDNEVIKCILDYVCEVVRKTDPEHIDHVWVGYDSMDTTHLQLVISFSTQPRQHKSSFFGLDTFYRQKDTVSHEACRALYSDKAKQNPLTFDEKRKLTECIRKHADKLMKNHSNLTIISGSPVRSQKEGALMEDCACIVLYCKVKGVIPFGERPFPTTLDGIPVDVREGFFSLCPSTPVSPGSFDFNQRLRMGCYIGAWGAKKGGTLGGFVTSGTWTGFLTCAHVLYGDKIENDIQQTYKWDNPDHVVVQPPDGEGVLQHQDRTCGLVKKAVFDPYRDVSVDAALVQVTDREPQEGLFSGLREDNVKYAGFDPQHLPCYNSGEIQKTIGREDQFKGVVKGGCTTGLTRGTFNLDGVHVKHTSISLGLNEESKVTIKNQYEILPTGTQVFFQAGDSGSLVFIMEPRDRSLKCIGMAIGSTSHFSCIVTPISDVLQALSLPDHLKVFHQFMDRD